MDQDNRRKKHAAETGEDPAIPDKLYFRIGEAARLLSVAPYVLRFWESEFPQLRPGKGGTGQRLYRRRDVEMALRIKHLLYQEGYTIPGARQLLKTEQRSVPEKSSTEEEISGKEASREPAQTRLRRLRTELREISTLLAGPAPPHPLSGPALRAAPASRRGLHLAGRRSAEEKGTSAFLFPVEQVPEED